MFSRFKGENIPALPGRFFETVQGVSKETNNQVSPKLRLVAMGLHCRWSRRAGS